MTSVRALLVLAVVLVSLPSPSRAEPTAPEATSGYRELVDEAVREYAENHFEEARALFYRAHAAQPTARTHRGIGITEFELRNYGESIKHLEQALASSEKPLDGKMRADTEALLARARGFVSRVVLDLQPEQLPARVIVDGVEVQVDPGRSVLLTVGQHMLEVRAPGHDVARRAVTVTGGEEQRLTIAFDADPVSTASMPVGEPSATAAASQPPIRTDGASRWYKNKWLWIGAAVAVVAGGVTAGMLLRPEGKSEPRAPTTTANTPPGAQLQALVAW